MNRVVITGLGVVSPLGHNVADMAASLRAGRGAIGPISNMPTESLIIKIGAEIRGFDPNVHFTDKQLPMLDRCSQLALVAAREAVAQSGLSFRDGLGARTATI